MNELLEHYEVGKPAFKKDVCQHLYIMNQEREQAQKAMPAIISNGPNGPFEMSLEETVHVLEKQRALIEFMQKRILFLEHQLYETKII